MATQMFMTKEIEAAFAKAGEQDVPDPIIIAKYFNPCGSQTWYMINYDPRDRVFFGYVTGMQEDELGYVSRDELESIRLLYGLKIERDYHWTPVPLSRVKSGEVR